MHILPASSINSKQFLNFAEVMTNQELQNLKNKYDIIGNDPALNRALEIAVAVAPTDITVLVNGKQHMQQQKQPKADKADKADKKPAEDKKPKAAQKRPPVKVGKPGEKIILDEPESGAAGENKGEGAAENKASRSHRRPRRNRGRGGKGKKPQGEGAPKPQGE